MSTRISPFAFVRDLATRWDLIAIVLVIVLVAFLGEASRGLLMRRRSGVRGSSRRLRTEIPPEEYARDRYRDGVMGTNLHAVWDYYVLESAKLPLHAYADRLAESMRPLITRRADPSAWAEESCGLVDKRRLYPRSHELTAAYLLSERPLAERRVVLAAKRLAQLLNEVLTLPPSL